MSEIDDELLALAGGGSDGEDGSIGSASPAHHKRRRSRTRSQTPVRKTRRTDSDEEEGEARSSAPGSPNSQASAPMDESDSDASVVSHGSISREPLVDREYPFEGLYRSAAEKRKIMSLVEVERESILADRRNEMQTYRQNQALAQMAAKRPNAADNKRGKRSGDMDVASEEEEEPKTTRSNRSRTGAKMDEYRRARADKSDRMRRLKEDNERGSRRRYDDAESDEEADWRRRSPTPEKKKQSVRREPLLVDFERLRIGRTGFGQICFKPGFEEAVVDCYVRVLGKPDRSSGQQHYHMLSIKGISNGKPYALEDNQGSTQIVTDQYVLAGIGKKTESYPFVAISDGRFTEAELGRHQDALGDNNLNVPRLAVLEDRLSVLRNLVNYELNNKEITEMVERKNQLRRRVDPAQREVLQRAIIEAEEAGNHILARQLQEDLDALGAVTGLAFRSNASKNAQQLAPGAHKSQQERLAELNRINRKKNVDNVRRAQLKEKMRTRELEAKAARGEIVVEDLSRRLKTKARFVHDVTDKENGFSKKEEVIAGGKAGDVEAQRRARDSEKAWRMARPAVVDSGIPMVHRPVTEDDIIVSLDLGIVVEL